MLRAAFFALVLLAPSVLSASVTNVGRRQAGCEQYGTYPVYKGPCETTSELAFAILLVHQC
jgi:hypothetical protein